MSCKPPANHCSGTADPQGRLPTYLFFPVIVASLRLHVYILVVTEDDLWVVYQQDPNTVGEGKIPVLLAVVGALDDVWTLHFGTQRCRGKGSNTTTVLDHGRAGSREALAAGPDLQGRQTGSAANTKEPVYN